MSYHVLDDSDPINSYREMFLYPYDDDKIIRYFLGNSLGLQPKKTRENMQNILNQWHRYGVEAFFSGDSPWMHLSDDIHRSMAKLIGSTQSEVAIMNTLTTNLHLALVSFYRPTKDRYKIIIEEKAFPSDVYALKSHLRYHGLDPKTDLLIVKSENHTSIKQEDIERVLEEEGEKIALTMFGGVNYYTGQVFDFDRITKVAHNMGSIVGFDLAHGVGNIELNLHKTNCDFAVWCNYKYINGGPGSPGGLFIHNKYDTESLNKEIPRFEGWWGNRKDTRFLMKDEFEPEVGVRAWQLSTPSPILLISLATSLNIFDEVGLTQLRKKSKKLTGYLRDLLDDMSTDDFTIITPELAGAQLSLRMKKIDKQLFNFLLINGVYIDWREPDVIRVAPVPLYNSFEDVYVFIKYLKEYIRK